MHEVWFGAGLLLLAGLSVGVARWAGVLLGWQPLIALVRATVQLAVVAALLRGVLTVPWTVVAFIALMLATASWTAGGRIKALPHGRQYAVIGVLAGAAVALTPCLLLHMVAWNVRHIVALAGIVIGNSMNAATLSGRRFAADARIRRDEIEGWFALGATPVQAYDQVGRLAARESLLPNLDQTRSTGLVTLPGAFVGALFGGAGPVAAAEFQLTVLAAIVLGMLVCAVVVTRLAARSPFVLAD